MTELPAVRAAGCDDLLQSRDGDWAVAEAQFAGQPAVGALAAETGAPALVAHVVDSDFAVVEADDPAGGAWRCVLSPQMALEYGCPEDWIGSAPEIAEQAARWATAAGLRPDAQAITDTVSAESDPFAEDLVYRLLGSLGLGRLSRAGLTAPTGVDGG